MTLQKLIILMRSKLIIQLHYILGRSSSDNLRPFWHCNFLLLKATILSNAIISQERERRHRTRSSNVGSSRAVTPQHIFTLSTISKIVHHNSTNIEHEGNTIICIDKGALFFMIMLQKLFE